MNFHELTKQMDQWENLNVSFGLGIENVNKEKIINGVKEKIDNINSISEHKMLRLNEEKIKISNNLSFIFSIGMVFEKQDKDLLNNILNYFDRNERIFIASRCSVLDYNNETIKLFEKKFAVENGNYHFALIIFQNDILEPIKFLTLLDQIVDYIILFNQKYGIELSALTPRESNYINFNPVTNKQEKNNGKIVRTLNPTTNNWQQHGSNTRRVYRKGYYDPNTNDFENLTEPQQINKFGTEKKWNEDELDQNSTYRRHLSGYHRDMGNINFGWFNKDGYQQGQKQRKKTKQSLYNQLNDESGIKTIPIDEVKGVHLKMNDYYETTTNQKEKPSYEIYETTGNNKFIDSIEKREENNWKAYTLPKINNYIENDAYVKNYLDN